MTRGRRNNAQGNRRDAWLDEEGGYSVDNFYTGSKDAQGHSTFIRVRIPDHVANALSVLIASGEIQEYRTVPDAFRDGIHHRIKYLAESRGTRELSKVAQLLEIDGEIGRRKQIYDTTEQVIGTLGEAIRAALRFGDSEEVTRMVADVHERLKKVLTTEEYTRIQPHVEATVQRIRMNVELNRTLL